MLYQDGKGISPAVRKQNETGIVDAYPFALSVPVGCAGLVSDACPGALQGKGQACLSCLAGEQSLTDKVGIGRIDG